MSAYAYEATRRSSSTVPAQAGVVAAVLEWRESAGGFRAPRCSTMGDTAHRRAPGGYWLVAGARRLQATRVEGIERLPAVVRDLSDGQFVAVAFVEHRRREDRKAIDEARSLVCLIEEFNLTHEDAADTLRRSWAVMSSTLRLRNLDSTVQRLVFECRPEMGHARAPLALEPGRSRGWRLTESWRTTSHSGRPNALCAR